MSDGQPYKYFRTDTDLVYRSFTLCPGAEPMYELYDGEPDDFTLSARETFDDLEEINVHDLVFELLYESHKLKGE